MNRSKALLIDSQASGQFTGRFGRLVVGRPKAEDPQLLELRAELTPTGFFRPAPGSYLARAALVLCVYGAAYGTLLTGPRWPLRLLCLVAVGFICFQGGFISHEAGHGSISRRAWINQALGYLFMSVLSGFSFRYWQTSHALHHRHPNHELLDPDMQSSLVSLSEEAARRQSGLGRLLTRWQAHLAVPLMSLWGFFLKWDGLGFLLRNRRSLRAEAAPLCLHALLWLGIPAMVLGPGDALINYALSTWFIGPYMGLTVIWHHAGTLIVRAGQSLSFVEHQVRTTRNLAPFPGADLLFGGTNNQIEHHLFPAAPSANHHLGRDVTRAFCLRHGLPYREVGLGAAIGEVLRHLAALSRGARCPADAPAPPAPEPAAVPDTSREPDHARCVHR